MITLNTNNPTVGRKRENDGFSQILREAQEFFAESNIQMVSGFAEILGEDALFSEYVNRMCSGLDADDALQLEQLMENARFKILSEATLANISPLAGLSMPTVRKMWLRTALKNAIPTETAKIPTFSISYMRPYLRDADGTRHYIPEDLRDVDNTLAEKAPLTRELVNVPTTTAFNVITESSGSLAASDAVDPIFWIDRVVFEVNDGEGGTEEKKVNVKIPLDINGKLYGNVATVDNTEDATEVTDTIFGTLDLNTGDLIVTSLKGNVVKIGFKGWFSSGNNTKTQSVSFEIHRKDVRIGTGAHINAPLEIEWLQDTLALYNIDGTVEVVDIMSNVVAQKLDHEIRDFFDISYENQGYSFMGYFDVKPAAGYAGSPLEWRKELHSVVEYWATKLKSYSAFNQGYFVIYGNPLDINLLSGIEWTYKHVQGERGGVSVNYDIGVMTANNVYHIVGAENVPQGYLTMFFVPNTDKYMTYKYYPYAFNVEKGYLDPQNPNVPSVMMTKRHTIEELVPIQCKIQILNNDGKLITSYAL
jgi:hypothetical protein